MTRGKIYTILWVGAILCLLFHPTQYMPAVIKIFFSSEFDLLRLPLYLVVAAVLIVHYGFFRTAGFLVGLALFPLILAARISLRTAWGLGTFLVTFLRRIVSVKALLMSFVVTPVCYYAILRSQNNVVLHVLIVLLGICTFVMMANVLRWAFRPTVLPASLLRLLAEGFAKNVRESEEKLSVMDDKDPKQREEKAKDVKWRLSVYRFLVRFMDRFVDRRNALYNTLALFVSMLLAAFGLVVVNFAFAYLAAHRANAETFGRAALSFGESLFFSLNTLTTSGLSDLPPKTALVRFLSSFELLAGVFLLTLLVSFFSLTHQAAVEDVLS